METKGRLLAAAGLVLLLVACATAEPRIYVDGNMTGFNWMNAVRHNGSATFNQLLSPPADSSGSNIISGYTAGSSTWNFKDLFAADPTGYGAINAVQTSNSASYLYGGCTEGTCDLGFNESSQNMSTDNRVNGSFLSKKDAINTYMNYSSGGANTVWIFGSGATATDGVGDCASGSVCLGDHTHSQYLTTAVLSVTGTGPYITSSLGVNPAIGFNETAGNASIDTRTAGIIGTITANISTLQGRPLQPNIDGANITSGTVADARLSANVIKTSSQVALINNTVIVGDNVASPGLSINGSTGVIKASGNITFQTNSNVTNYLQMSLPLGVPTLDINGNEYLDIKSNSYPGNFLRLRPTTDGSQIQFFNSTASANNWAILKVISDALGDDFQFRTNGAFGNIRVTLPAAGGAFYPDTDAAYNLGKPAYRWHNLLAQQANVTAIVTSTMNLTNGAHVTSMSVNSTGAFLISVT